MLRPIKVARSFGSNNQTRYDNRSRPGRFSGEDLGGCIAFGVSSDGTRRWSLNAPWYAASGELPCHALRVKDPLVKLQASM